MWGSLLWNWKDVKETANPYAAFPSVHTLWSCFVAVIWLEVLQIRRPYRYIILLYPMLTIFCIIITANHFIFDALGAIVLLTMVWGTLAFCRRFASRRSTVSAAAGLGPLYSSVSCDNSSNEDSENDQVIRMALIKNEHTSGLRHEFP